MSPIIFMPLLPCGMSSNVSHPFSSSTASGTFGAALIALAQSSDLSWVINSGITNHMFGISTLFTSYSLLFGHDIVTIADGTLATVAGKAPSDSLTNLLCLRPFMFLLFPLTCS